MSLLVDVEDKIIRINILEGREFVSLVHLDEGSLLMVNNYSSQPVIRLFYKESDMLKYLNIIESEQQVRLGGN